MRTVDTVRMRRMTSSMQEPYNYIAIWLDAADEIDRLRKAVQAAGGLCDDCGLTFDTHVANHTLGRPHECHGFTTGDFPASSPSEEATR